MGRFWMMLGCLFCGLTVVCGAFGAHSLRQVLDAEAMAIYKVATEYMMFHGLALLALGLWNHWEKWSRCLFVGLFFTFGILLFSGSLYAMALTQANWLGFLTPAGGLFFILGWLFFMHAIFNTRNKFI